MFDRQVPQLTPEARVQLTKPDTTVRCPITAQPLRLKQLTAVKFTRVDDDKDLRGQVAKERYMCAAQAGKGDPPPLGRLVGPRPHFAPLPPSVPPGAGAHASSGDLPGGPRERCRHCQPAATRGDGAVWPPANPRRPAVPLREAHAPGLP